MLRFERKWETPIVDPDLMLPIDDHQFRVYVVGRVTEEGELRRMRTRMNGNLWEELTEAEHRDNPNDVEAMVSQGRIARHPEEHLASNDQGIVMLRRLLKAAVGRAARRA
jgi:hypothetical protein